MKSSNTTPAPDSATPFGFSSTEGFYRLGKVSRGDVSNQISMQLDRLRALLKMTYGEQGETFRMLNDSLQDNFMWACSGLVDECKDLFEHMEGSSEVAA